MRFSIITPTIQRESLADLCKNIDSQTFTDFEHIIAIDSDSADYSLITKCADLRNQVERIWIGMGKKYSDGGNTPRREALKGASGEYIYFADDDNILADANVLKDVSKALEEAGNPPWGLFPITRLGGRFFTDPPRSCHVDTMNVILRRDIAYWPDTDAYGTDGILVDDLMARGVPYVAFPEFRPIGIIPKISFCE